VRYLVVPAETGGHSRRIRCGKRGHLKTRWTSGSGAGTGSRTVHQQGPVVVPDGIHAPIEHEQQYSEPTTQTASITEVSVTKSRLNPGGSSYAGDAQFVGQKTLVVPATYRLPAPVRVVTTPQAPRRAGELPHVFQKLPHPTGQLRFCSLLHAEAAHDAQFSTGELSREHRHRLADGVLDLGQ
jgi:hypothetical protein